MHDLYLMNDRIVVQPIGFEPVRDPVDEVLPLAVLVVSIQVPQLVETSVVLDEQILLHAVLDQVAHQEARYRGKPFDQLLQEFVVHLNTLHITHTYISNFFNNKKMFWFRLSLLEKLIKYNNM